MGKGKWIKMKIGGILSVRKVRDWLILLRVDLIWTC